MKKILVFILIFFFLAVVLNKKVEAGIADKSEIRGVHIADSIFATYTPS